MVTSRSRKKTGNYRSALSLKAKKLFNPFALEEFQGDLEVLIHQVA